MRLEGRTTVVTGAGSGIGRAACELFASEGARVVAVDLVADAAASTAAGVGGVAVAGSVADPALWDEVVSVSGDVTLAYLNAGVYGHGGPIEDLPLDLYQRTVDANIGGVVLGTRALVPLLRANGGGAIVATASVAGIVAFAGNPVYTMTKHAVTGFVQAMAAILAADRITVDAVCPGVVDTPMTVEATGIADSSTLGIPLITPQTIAAEALDLALSDGTGRCRWVRAGADSVDWHSPDFRDLLR